MSDSSLLHAVAGAGAGCASLAITYPLYARMVRQQVQSSADAARSAAAVVEAKGKDVSPLSAALAEFKKLLTAEGIAPHFAGLPAALCAISIQSCVFYYFFQAFKNLHGVSTSPLGNMFVGTEAGIATVMLTNPLWVINSRQITRKATVKQLLSAEGAASAGQDASLPSSSQRSDNSSNNSSSRQQAPHLSPSSHSDATAALSSGATTAVASAVPASAASAAASDDVSLSDVGFFTALRLLVAREGLAGVYSGVGPALALVSSPALQFASYEWMRALLLRHRVRALARQALLSAATVASAVLSSSNVPASAAVSTVTAAAVVPVPQLTSLDLFLLGALSKIVATLLTYPIQTLKARLQRDGSPYAGFGWMEAVVRCVADMARAPDALAQFYQGLPAKILQTGLTSAFLFVFRERILWILVRLTQRGRAKAL
jgi:adenine nucleotide transporter 17